MKILELFAGTKSFGKEAWARGHEVFSVDIMPEFKCDLTKDILELTVDDIPWIPDVIWASPPCTYFSVASIGHHWNKDNTPKTKAAELGVLIVKKVIELTEYFLKKNTNLKYYWENPCGKLRKLDFMQRFMRKETTYCQYGDTRRKPTDFWTNDLLWNPKPKCRPNGKNYKALCHVGAPRGSATPGSTQGIKGNKLRSVVPPELCLEVIISAEQQFHRGLK